MQPSNIHPDTMRRTKAAQRKIPTHRTPSGMGGVFDVVIVEDRGDKALCRVVANGPDWNGYEIVVAKSELRVLA